MNRYVLVFLSFLLLLLLGIAGLLLFAYSSTGNQLIQSYIQTRLNEQSSIPVEVEKFHLEAGKTRLVLKVNRQATVEVLAHYQLLSQRFKGIYRAYAKDFHYEGISVGDMRFKGKFAGTPDEIRVEGSGEALDAPLAYRLALLEQEPKDIEVLMQGVSLEKLLLLLGEKPLLKGKMDVDIRMPDIGEEFANGYGSLRIEKAYFDREVVKESYDLHIPKESYLSATVDVKLKGETLESKAVAKGNLFELSLQDAKIDVGEQNISAKYMMDVKEMAILTRNQLSGPLKLKGSLAGNKEKYRIKGVTHSLGGTLLFDVAEVIRLSFQELSLLKLERLLKQPYYVQGLLSGSFDIDKAFKEGSYRFDVAKGAINAAYLQEQYGYQIPQQNHFTLRSEGKVDKGVLTADLTLKSSVSDVKLTALQYVIEEQRLSGRYDLFVPDVGVLIPDNKALKRGYVSAKGELKYDKLLHIKGKVKGLGEQLVFDYDGKGVKLNAQNLFVEKLLSLSNLPRYVKGKLSADVNLQDIKAQDGSFLLKGRDLVTQPTVMERLMGKKLAVKFDVDSKGEIRSGVANLETRMKSPVGNIVFSNMRYDTKQANLISDYHVSIPELAKLSMLLGTELHGLMELRGKLEHKQVLKVSGSTSSVGGKIDYNLVDKDVTLQMKRVPVDRILTLLGHNALVQGDASGSITYHTQKQTGEIKIDIDGFKIKPSSVTHTIKMFIGKDPARIIYEKTTLRAKINGDVTHYTLQAKGTRSSISISDGYIDKKRDKHDARFKFVYEKYVVTGRITGSAKSPSIVVDPSSIMQSKAGEKIQQKLDKALGGDMGKAVGGFLKGLKF